MIVGVAGSSRLRRVIGCIGVRWVGRSLAVVAVDRRRSVGRSSAMPASICCLVVATALAVRGHRGLLRSDRPRSRLVVVRRSFVPVMSRLRVAEA